MADIPFVFLFHLSRATAHSDTHKCPSKTYSSGDTVELDGQEVVKLFGDFVYDVHCCPLYGGKEESLYWELPWMYYFDEY